MNARLLIISAAMHEISIAQQRRFKLQTTAKVEPIPVLEIPRCKSLIMYVP